MIFLKAWHEIRIRLIMRRNNYVSGRKRRGPRQDNRWRPDFRPAYHSNSPTRRKFCCSIVVLNKKQTKNNPYSHGQDTSPPMPARPATVRPFFVFEFFWKSDFHRRLDEMISFQSHSLHIWKNIFWKFSFHSRLVEIILFRSHSL